jgi:penicillin-binding protein 2
LEKVLQQQLAGTLGAVSLEIHASGKVLRTREVRKPMDGESIQLTLDARLQQVAWDNLKDRIGTVIMSDPRTGEILVMVSSPGFDPNNIQPALLADHAPFLNRAVGVVYPPGSTFKMMTAYAGLTNNITADEEYEDTGVLNVGAFSFGNWYYRQYGRTEGMVSMRKALQRSNDIYFYRLGEAVGADAIAHSAALFGYGKPAGIELPGEKVGLIPTPQWKKETNGEGWYLGNTYHMAIGQGDVLVTPLQIHQATSALAMNGKQCFPHILRKLNGNGQIPAGACRDLEINAEHIQVIRDGMTLACEKGGTGYPFFDEQPVKVACKTGTAELGLTDEQGRRRTNAAFTVFAPFDAPRFAVTVYLEATEEKPFLEGSADAAPIAKAVVTKAVELGF